MNTLLTKHVQKEEGKTHAESVAAYAKAWENNAYLLRPLMLMLKERIQEFESTKDSDFDVPNHYAKVMFRNGKKEEAKLLMSLLPKSIAD